jgi:uroporphyrinogen III methyltransferase/synthase
VGAGPGDPGLLTRRGARLLRRCDVVVYDRLVDPRVLALAPPGARRIFAGKSSDAGGAGQDRIKALLVAHARRGRRVVRLKGGDPFVFGRGGEEVEALVAAGVRVRVVPGVTSAVAVPAAAGIPLTRRGTSSSFAVVTARSAGGRSTDLGRVATAVDTLVLLMGAARITEIAAALVAYGRSPDTPVALIRSGTTGAQRTVTGTLRDIGARARDAHLAPPVVAVVGDIVSLRAVVHPAPSGREFAALEGAGPRTGRRTGGPQWPLERPRPTKSRDLTTCTVSTASRTTSSPSTSSSTRGTSSRSTR